MTTLVRLRHYSRGRTLHLDRTPKYLRFVARGSDWGTLDALDHPADRVRAGETVIPARLASMGTVHMDRRVNGRHLGEWHSTAEYEPCECCLTQEQLRDNVLWREWCEQWTLVEDKR